MLPQKSNHTLHAERMMVLFDYHTYRLVCSCGETKAVVTIAWADGEVMITAVEDDVCVHIPRRGFPYTVPLQ